ncbi:MFS transporter [Variovorax sp. J2P1-59]|uniref:MFS transporter n=1 Tax=Variovorax flavidus TaxID=3053501 RepID=UPI00257565AC|nr:MFS transporter [Variovorax sp. J2P1-59]MDM0075457.1 MFS transporter [Variovorax sp. J2P1-59]
MSSRLLPVGVDASALPLLIARALRAFGDGYMAVLLPAYLLSIGLGTLEVGIVSTATMLGSAAATLAVGAWGYRFAGMKLLRGAAMLMAATGLGFASLSSFWPLLIVALVGTLNPSSGDVSVFLPLEHARLAGAAQGHARTALFARYSLVGALCAALGALAAAVPDWLVRHAGLPRLDALRGMFLVYAAIGLAVFWLYRNPPAREGAADAADAPAAPVAPAPLGASRGVVVRLAALFSVDAFAGGLTVNALMSLWLLERFGLSLAQAGVFFFWTGLLGAASQLAAPPVARRIGLLNTMVFTHLPANICLVLAALAPSLPVALGLLMVRSALSSMDVPTRTAYVMAVVTPAERSAAASFTAVPRSLAAAISPTLSGAMFAAGWISLPLIACGLLKIAYDLTLWRAMRRSRVEGL